MSQNKSSIYHNLTRNVIHFNTKDWILGLLWAHGFLLGSKRLRIQILRVQKLVKNSTPFLCKAALQHYWNDLTFSALFHNFFYFILFYLKTTSDSRK